MGLLQIAVDKGMVCPWVKNNLTDAEKEFLFDLAVRSKMYVE